MNLLRFLRLNKIAISPIRSYSQVGSGGSRSTIHPPSSPSKSATTSTIKNASGLSAKCVKPNSQPVGPGASVNGEYKVPEYYCYNKMSYYEAEIEMAKFRLPQPSAL